MRPRLFRQEELGRHVDAAEKERFDARAGAGDLVRGLQALVGLDETHKPTLKKAGYLTRDARKKERKKYGQRGARARFQFSKR